MCQQLFCVLIIFSHSENSTPPAWMSRALTNTGKQDRKTQLVTRQQGKRASRFSTSKGQMQMEIITEGGVKRISGVVRSVFLSG